MARSSIIITAADRPHFVLRNGKAVRTTPLERAEAVEEDTFASALSPASDKVGAGKKFVLASFVITLFIPNYFSLGSVVVTPNLLILLAAFFPLLIRLIGGKSGRATLPDWLVIGFVLWAAITRVLMIGPYAVEPVGSLVLQTLSAYLIGRLLVRGEAEMRYAFGVVTMMFVLLSGFFVLESVTGRKLLLDIAHLFGPALRPARNDPRMGLARAQGVFEHPILLGIFAASMISISIYFFFRRDQNKLLRFAGAPACLVSALTTLSSGPLLSINIQIGLMLWALVFRRMKKRWTLLMGLLATAYVTVDALSNRTPFHVFIDYGTFNSQSSYNRILIWRFGSAAVLKSPMMGHWNDDWERPVYMSSSMDNFWLVIAYRYGLPGVIMLAGAFILTLARMSRREGPTHQRDMMRRGAIFSLVATMVAIVSVHLWNNAYVFFMFALGAVSWLATAESEGAGRAGLSPGPASEERQGIGKWTTRGS